MKSHRLLLVIALLLGSVTAAHAQFVWTGLGADNNVATNGNWQGGTAPPSNGTADVLLGYGLNTDLLLPANLSLHSVVLANGDDYTLHASSAVTLTLAAGAVITGSSDNNTLWIAPNITVHLAAAQTFDAGDGQIEINGQITGSSPVTLMSSSADGGVFIFTNTGAGNTYTGATTFGNGADPVTVAFWNSAPFGTGSVNVITSNAQTDEFIAHGTQTLLNAFTFTGPGTASFKSWDAPLTLTGPITLASNTTFSALISQTGVPSPNQDGSFPVPGITARHPIVFSGGITGTYNLTVTGSGVTVIEYNVTNPNVYGTTTVSNSGSLVFSGSNAIPTGSLNVAVNSAGYAGDATPGEFATFLGHITASSNGAVGLDTLPGAATATFNDALNLTSSNSGLRIGTATSAILTGAITPQGTNYQFGNGGGTLYVQSNLGPTHGLTLNSSSNVPLTLYLQGTNTYAGGTTVSNGFLIFDAYYSVPISGALIAAGSSTNVGGSYIGYTDLISGASSPTGFLAGFNKTSTWGILGFDTHAGNPTVSISSLDLTGFNDGVFIGTATSAQIDASNLTGTTVANTFNAPNTFRFTAGKGGTLTVNGSIGGTTAVMLGTPSTSGIYSNGTVVMNGSSTYSGGTTLNAFNTSGLTLALSNNMALGTGALNVLSNLTGGGGGAALQTTSGGINLANAINLTNTGTPGVNDGPQLYLTGTNSFTLSGPIAGDLTTGLWLVNASPLTVSLGGDNSNFLGNIEIVNGAMNFLSDHAPGGGTLTFANGSTGIATFSSAAPILYGIKGDSGNVVIPGGTNLSFDISDDLTHDTEFSGVISGSGSVTVTAPSAPDGVSLYLHGHNTYTGGTTIVNNAVLALGTSDGAGTGAVTLNAPNGGLVLNSGATFTNSLTYTSGGLGGFGTFAPSNLSTITFDTGKIVMPGLGGLTRNGAVGTLTLATNVVFANGGGYVWNLQDATTAGGFSLLNISGSLNITATAGGFGFEVVTFDGTGEPGLATLTAGTPYSLLVLHATGGITGFSPSAFTFDTSQFQNGTLGATSFTLSQSGNDLYLNFTPVPEPSTCALLGLGLGAVLVPALRRRRARK